MSKKNKAEKESAVAIAEFDRSVTENNNDTDTKSITENNRLQIVRMNQSMYYDVYKNSVFSYSRMIINTT